MMHDRSSPVVGSLRTQYDAAFYDRLDPDVRASAEVIVPMLIDLLRPASVVDIGCGRGTWLRTFSDHGVSDIAGVDGPHISPEELEIPAEAFLVHDLNSPLPDPPRKYAVAMSLEVAEHLRPEAAAAFVESLVRYAPVVVFSAAVPTQGGTGHVNEQWPSYWAELFATHDFVAVDAIRPLVWDRAGVAFWYAQNLIVYVARDHMSALDLAPAAFPLDVVHPTFLRTAVARALAPAPPASLRSVLRSIPAAAGRAFRSRVHGRET